MNQLITIKDQMLNQFYNLSCYEEFEMRCALTGISKVDILKEFDHKVNDYYFFISNDGIFNWYDLEGNHIENPGVLKELEDRHIPKTITKCIIPSSVTSIGYMVFWDCNSLKEIVIPNSVTNIDSRAFAYCESLTSITIPDSVTMIGHSAFSHCKSLTSITIPNYVTGIGIDVFFDCTSLKEVIFKGKTLEQVKQMKYYPFGIKDESIIKCEI